MPAEASVDHFTWVIDDDPAILQVVSRRLEADGWRVRTFAAAEPALEALASGAPIAAVLDNGLPGMMGLQALPRLAAAGVRVVMITAYPSEEVHKDALLLGAQDFMVKPMDLDELTRRLRALFDR
ncbi:MAG: response regulator [Elusimicrobiota bacterium]